MTNRLHQLIQIDFGNGNPAQAVCGMLQIVDDINARLGQNDAEGVAMLMTCAALLMQRASIKTRDDKAFFMGVADVCFDSALIFKASRDAKDQTRQ